MADKTINTLDTELVTVGANDLIGVWDVAAGQYKKAKRSNVVGATITGGGTIALGGYTLTVPATGTAALLGVSNVFTQPQVLPLVRASAPVTMLDDTAVALPLGTISGIIILVAGLTTLACGAVAFRTGSSLMAAVVASAPGTKIVAGTAAVLTGTSGVDGNFTVNAHSNGNLYLENRTGTSFALNYLIIGG